MQNTYFHAHSIFIRSIFPQPCGNPPSSPGNATESLYAVIQVGVGCYGVGFTRAAAITEARKWLAIEPDLHSLPNFSKNLDRGALCIARCTEHYAQKIKEKGGIGWVPFSINAECVFDCESPDDFEVLPGEIEHDIEKNKE